MIAYRRREVVNADKAEKERLLAPLAEAGKLVGAAAQGYLNLLDMWFHRYDSFKLNLTPGEIDTPRLLVHAYEWRNSLSDAGASSDKFPVLCRLHRYAWGTKPEPVLKTIDLTLKDVNGNWIPLPRQTRGQSTEELSLWNRHLLPLVTNAGSAVVRRKEIYQLVRSHERLSPTNRFQALKAFAEFTDLDIDATARILGGT